jgi:hypothetical protein
LFHAGIKTPAVVLPRANASTIGDRLRKWFLWSSNGFGSKLAGGFNPAEVTSHFETKLDKVAILMTKDSLAANLVDVAGEQAAFYAKNIIAEAAGSFPQHFTVVLSIDCQHHQGNLAQKPGLLQIPLLTSFLVRPCHLSQASNFKRKFELQMVGHAKRMWGTGGRRQILRLPPECVERRQQQAAILSLCSADIPAGADVEILSFFNFWWHLDCIVHWCLPGCCDDDAASMTKMLHLFTVSQGFWKTWRFVFRSF